MSVKKEPSGRGGGVCIVGIVQSLFASTDDWANQLEGAAHGWPGFLRTLRIYLTHFRGQRSMVMKWMGPAAGTEAEAWETLTAALGLQGMSVGQRATAPAGVPAFSGVVEYVAQSPCEALLRFDTPGPGVAALGALKGCTQYLGVARWIDSNPAWAFASAINRVLMI